MVKTVRPGIEVRPIVPCNSPSTRSCTRFSPSPRLTSPVWKLILVENPVLNTSPMYSAGIPGPSSVTVKIACLFCAYYCKRYSRDKERISVDHAWNFRSTGTGTGKKGIVAGSIEIFLIFISKIQCLFL